MLISKLDAAHARPFQQAAALYASPTEPLGACTCWRCSVAAPLRAVAHGMHWHCFTGVVSTETAVRFINSVTGSVNLGKLSRGDIIRSVFAHLVGDVEVVQQDELLVRVAPDVAWCAVTLLTHNPRLRVSHRWSSRCLGSMLSQNI